MFWNITDNTNPENDTCITKPQYKKSKKKKNTYVVHLNAEITPDAFKLCAYTPLVVEQKNGINIFEPKSTTMFPIPGACEMENLYRQAPEWREIAGDKTAQTIIEYLDKKTGIPVLILYPTGHINSLVVNENVDTVAATRLNHASRQDFQHKCAHIKQLVATIDPLLKERAIAMRHAPIDYKQRTDYIKTLNQHQIETARSIIAQHQR